MLNLKYLEGYTSIGDIEDAVLNLPNGEGRLEIAYKKAIEIIRAQQSPSYKLAVKTLSWLVYAKRALLATELQHALAINAGMEDFDPKYLTPMDIIGSVCAGLVAFDRLSGVIRLVHYTTREFLVRDSTCDNAEKELTVTSITYLSFNAFSEGRSTNEADYQRRRVRYLLFSYCAKHWGAHAKAVLDSSDDPVLLALVLQFLDKELHVSAATQAVVGQKLLYGQITTLQDQIAEWPPVESRIFQLTQVHLAAKEGLTRVIDEYVRQNIDLDAPDSEGNTPLSYAARGGHLEVCRSLLESNRTHPNHEFCDGMTAILLAAYGRNEEVVKILLEHGANADPIEDTKEVESPLCVAASNGDIEIMRLLLDNGAEVNRQSWDGNERIRIPLPDAYRSGHLDAIIFLLARGGNPNLLLEYHQKFLGEALENDDQDMVNVLRGMKVEIQKIYDFHHYVSLADAALGGFSNVVTQLLRAGADPNWQNPSDPLRSSPVIEVCANLDSEEDHEEVVRQLLEHGADPNIQNGFLSTAIHYAALNGSAGIVRLLLEHGANPNITNKERETALLIAFEHGHGDSVKALLQGKADPNTGNTRFKNALFCAAERGYTSICKLLLDSGLSVNCQNIAGDSPLFLAAYSGSESTVQLLICRGADIQHRNLMQETALFFAATTAIARLLIEAGATLNPMNLISETPLIRAVADWKYGKKDTISLVTLFLENGADPNPMYRQKCLSNTYRQAWDVLYSLFNTNLCIKRRKHEEQTIYCKAAQLIWGSLRESYTHEQMVSFICQAICHPLCRRENRFRISWIKGKKTALLRYMEWRHVGLVARTMSDPSTEIQTGGEIALFEEAIAARNPQIMEILLGRVKDSSMGSYLPVILQRAAELGDVPMMELLFSKQSFDSHYANLALVKALHHGHVEAVVFLLEKRAEVHIAQGLFGSKSLLHLAISTGGTVMVNMLLKRQIEIDIKNRFGQTPLFYAIKKRNQALVELLLEQNIEIDAQDIFGRTPLFHAVQYCSFSIAQILLQRHANPNITAFDDRKDDLASINITDVDVSDDQFFQEKLKIHREQGSPSKRRNLTPLLVAAEAGQGDLVKALLKNGADPNHRDGDGNTAICLAAGKGFEAIVKILLDAGSNVNHPEDPSKSPLMWAVEHKHPVRQNYFKDHYFIGNENSDAYHLAKGDIEAVVRLLLQYGADPNPTNERGQTPLQVLSQARKDSRSLGSALVKAGGNPNPRSKFGRTPLMNAIVGGLYKMTTALLEAPNIDRDAADIFGRTAITEVAKTQNYKILKLLRPDCEVDQPLVVNSERPKQNHRCDICRIWTRDESPCSHVCFMYNRVYVCEECRKLGAESMEDLGDR